MVNSKKPYLFLVITFFLWGSLYVVSKYAFADIPPLTLLLIRYVIGSLVLAVLARRKGLRPVAKEHRKYFILFGVSGYFLAVGLQMAAVNIMSASMASLVNSMNPVFISLFALILLKEKMTWRKAAGILCSLCGVAFILGVQTGGANIPGVLLSVASVLLWSLNSVLIKRISAFYSSEQITLGAMLTALPVCLLASAVELQTEALRISVSSGLAAVYIAVFCTALANVFWNGSLRRIDASVCSLFYPLQPLFSAILGVILLNESIDFGFAAGGLLIAAGVFLGVAPPKRK